MRIFGESKDFLGTLPPSALASVSQGRVAGTQAQTIHTMLYCIEAPMPTSQLPGVGPGRVAHLQICFGLPADSPPEIDQPGLSADSFGSTQGQ